MNVNVKGVAIRRLSPSVVTLTNAGDRTTASGLRAWDELVRSALSSALVGRATCIVEEKQAGPLLATSMNSAASARVAESKHLKATCLDAFGTADVDAVVESSEFEARWLWIVVSQDPLTALRAADSIAKAGDAIEPGELPTTEEALLSRYDGTEIWWLNPSAGAEEILSEAASHSGWRVVSVIE